ncbi:MAG TPA: VOC family protein [Thermoanaerobaculia bacterium]|nr:VOC family protein [Thermoanaerobaculia bacterium]
MPEVNTYLFFNGNCAEAMKFYEKTLGGKLELMAARGTPAETHVPPGSVDKILHGRLKLDGGDLLASDWMAPEPFEGKKGFRVSLGYKTVADARRIFDALSKGGSVQMPFEKTFFAEGFGMLVDRFGTAWMVGAGFTA